jgi:hypothetical protein
MKVLSLVLFTISLLNFSYSYADYSEASPGKLIIHSDEFDIPVIGLPEFEAPVIDISESFNSGYEVKVTWNESREKVIQMTCSTENMRPCMQACGGYDQCIITEGLCYNCIGNDLFIVNFYKNLGLSVNGTGIKLHDSLLYGLLRSNDFITLEANSVFNIISDYDSKSMKKKFRNLCPENTINEPVVFAQVDRNRKPIDISFVLCDKEVYEMTMSNSYYDYETNTSAELY